MSDRRACEVMSLPHDGPTVLTLTSPFSSPEAAARASAALAPSATLSTRPDTRMTRPPSVVVASWNRSTALSPKSARAVRAWASVKVADGTSHTDPPSKSIERLRPRVTIDASEMMMSTVETIPTRTHRRGKSKSLRPR